MVGGAGSDTYGVDSAADVVTEAASAGNDQVNSSVNYTLGANVEMLGLLGSANLNGTGNTLNNTLIGSSGANILDGKAGADAMSGGGGNDIYGIDNAGDVVTETSASGGIDQVNSYVTFGLGANLEKLVLRGSAAIDGGGNALDNTITGNTGANVLDGKAGADAMAGGAGDDLYYVDNVGDVVTESAGGGTDRINSYVSLTLRANIETLALRGSDNLKGAGNALDNLIAGNNGDNVLKGGLGLDTMIGGAGDDLFKFDTALSPANVDAITDFTVGADGLQLENSVFTALGAAGVLAADAFHTGASAADASDRIIYDNATGALY
jgi:Ca2+-binding RTX toxin-like protein